MPTSTSTTKHYKPKGSKDKLIESEEKTTGAFDIFSKFITTHEATDPETLVDIKITNPLKRIYELIADIKKHQSTTFSLKFTIPLIALPIFLLVAFQLGKGQSNCMQLVSSKTGIIKNISVEVPENTPGKLSRLKSFFSFLPGNNTSTNYVAENRSVLVDQSGLATNVLHPQSLDMNQFSNANVIVTGNYSSCTNVITVVSDKNIEFF